MYIKKGHGGFEHPGYAIGYNLKMSNIIFFNGILIVIILQMLRLKTIIVKFKHDENTQQIHIHLYILYFALYKYNFSVNYFCLV